MQLEVGNIYEGKVTGITKFGAFVELDAKTTGMVHISEVANTFVNEIKDHLQEGQIVKVKVLTVGEDGKISLSIKKALPREERPRQPREGNNGSNNQNRGGNRFGGDKKPSAPKSTQPEQYEPRQSTLPKSDNKSFEEMLSKFKLNSEEKMSDLKHIYDNRRKGASRKGKN